MANRLIDDLPLVDRIAIRTELARRLMTTAAFDASEVVRRCNEGEKVKP